MFARLQIQIQPVRLYQSSNFKNTKSVARFANSRISRAVKERQTHEADPKVHNVNPSKHYEPFPFAVTEENKGEVVRKVIMPLFDVPYAEQLSSKESNCRNALRSLARDLFKDGTPIRIDVTRLPCRVKPIVPSPQLTRYRSKDELSIWYGHDGSTITAGFMVFPISKHGNTVCIEPNNCDTIKEESLRLIDLIQIFLREQAKLPVCFSLGEAGGWRRFMIKGNSEGELMLIGIINPRGLRVQQVLDERDNFKNFMTEKCDQANVKLASLYYQPCPNNRCNHIDVPYELLHGEPHIQEKICNRKFVISPESFIHDNVKAAEILYQSVIETIDESFMFKEKNVKPLIIDVRCGIGVLALSLADMASKIVGIDTSDQTIADARINAELNDVKNVEFICAHLEIVLERILEKYSKFKSEILVVCDTPNAGLHPNIIEVLRECQEVNKILLITPNISGFQLQKNLFKLCKRGDMKSLPPFAPILAAPIDTSPHAEKYQTILAFERVPR